MHTLLTQINEIEASLGRLSQQLPDLPVAEILASRLLVHLGKELSGLIDERLRPHGLTDIEFRALMIVYSLRERSAHPGELCTSLANSPANVTRITDNLVERGLLTRLPDEQDRRRLMLRLTARGEALVQQLLPLMLDPVRDSYLDFTAQDLEQLLRYLKKMANALDRLSARTL